MHLIVWVGLNGMESCVHVVESPPSKHAFIHWSLFINPIFLLYEQWALNSINTKRTVAMLLSCEDGNKQSLFDGKLSLDFHPPLTHPAKKKRCKQKKTTRQEEHQLGENLRVWERTGRGGRKGKGTLLLFCSVCLHHQRGIPGIQASCLRGCSSASSLMLSIFSCTRLITDSEGR